MRNQLLTALAEEGIFVTEAELAEMMQRAQRARHLMVEVPPSVYDKWQRIQFELASGDIDNAAAHTQFEQEVFPHLGIRPGVDYDPRTDTIDIRPRRPVRSIGLA